MPKSDSSSVGSSRSSRSIATAPFKPTLRRLKIRLCGRSNFGRKIAVGNLNVKVRSELRFKAGQVKVTVRFSGQKWGVKGGNPQILERQFCIYGVSLGPTPGLVAQA